MSWVKVEEIKGGQLVKCKLCGKRICHLTFWASDTNYAEAFRLATAYAWQHEHGEPHRAAVAAFHANPPPTLRDEDRLLYEIFGKPVPDENAMRRDAAKRAAALAHRKQASS